MDPEVLPAGWSKKGRAETQKDTEQVPGKMLREEGFKQREQGREVLKVKVSGQARPRVRASRPACF